MMINSSKLLILLLIIFKLLTPLLLGQEDVDDPFGDDEESHLLPRKASSLDKLKTKDENAIRAEIMVKHMPLLYEPFASLSLTTRDLTSVSDIQASDEVYEVSHLFPNCEGREDLWVVYNRTSSKLVANADLLLRASVNDYVYRVGERMPKRFRFSLTYIEVDRSVPLNIKSLNNADYKLLFKRSGVANTDLRFIFDNAEMKLMIEPIISHGSDCVYQSLMVDGKYDFEVDTVCRIGELHVQEAGISEGNRKRILITQFLRDDLTGKTDGNQRVSEVSQTDMKQAGVEDLTPMLGHIRELPILFGHKGDGLIEVPRWMKASKDDVVYNLTSMFQYAGLSFGEDEWVIRNDTTGKIYFKGASSVYLQIESLKDDLFTRNPQRISSVMTFYEVDSIIDESEQWSVDMVLSSNPLLLGRVGYSSRSGEQNKAKSELGIADVNMIFSDDGVHLDCSFDIELKLKGRDIQAGFMKSIKRDVLRFIELGKGSDSSRKIVMMVDIKVENLKYKRLQ